MLLKKRHSWSKKTRNPSLAMRNFALQNSSSSSNQLLVRFYVWIFWKRENSNNEQILKNIEPNCCSKDLAVIINKSVYGKDTLFISRYVYNNKNGKILEDSRCTVWNRLKKNLNKCFLQRKIPCDCVYDVTFRHTDVISVCVSLNHHP